MDKYDVCVIGGGPSGFAAAMRCWDFGKRVCLIERDFLGGAGIFNGALSSKTLWELSRDYRRVMRRDRGYAVQGVSVDYAQVCRSVDDAVREKADQMERQLAALSERAVTEHAGVVHRLRGTASFIDPYTVHVEGTEAGQSRDVRADAFIIATGSRPRALPDIAIDGECIVTSDHVQRMDRFPRSMVILGAGVVGCEFATIFANFGQTKVYVIDRAERILPFEDEDIARRCSMNLEAKGVTVHNRAKLLEMKRVGDEVEYTIEHHGGGHETIRVERALISVGRVPNVESLALDRAGVELDERGHIKDVDTQTSVPHIYAVGDVTLDIALVNVGEIEGRHAAERICGLEKGPLSYENLSTIMFLDPEVASIGLNEQQAQRAKVPYRVAVYDYALINRAIAMRSTDGFIKVLATTDDEPRILGMRALGSHASTMIEAVSLMIQHGRSARELAELYHPHPAMTEGLQDCVRMLLGSSIYKPCVFQSELRLSRIDYT